MTTTQREGRPAAGVPTVEPCPGSLGARRELVCAGCGYGAIAVSPPERCPMCGASAWVDRRIPLRTHL